MRIERETLESPAAATGTARRDELYRELAAAHGAALERLARGYQANPDRRRDLLQEIHLALWQSLASFDGRCSGRTWAFRVAHNVATSHAIRDRRLASRQLVGLDALEELPAEGRGEEASDARHALERLLGLIHRLRPLDRQVILSYLEGLDAASIAEITGLTPGNVATKIHRIKQVLARHLHEGGRHAR